MPHFFSLYGVLFLIILISLVFRLKLNHKWWFFIFGLMVCLLVAVYYFSKNDEDRVIKSSEYIDLFVSMDNYHDQAKLLDKASREIDRPEATQADQAIFFSLMLSGLDSEWLEPRRSAAYYLSQHQSLLTEERMIKLKPYLLLEDPQIASSLWLIAEDHSSLIDYDLLLEAMNNSALQGLAIGVAGRKVQRMKRPGEEEQLFLRAVQDIDYQTGKQWSSAQLERLDFNADEKNN